MDSLVPSDIHTHRHTVFYCGIGVVVKWIVFENFTGADACMVLILANIVLGPRWTKDGSLDQTVRDIYLTALPKRKWRKQQVYWSMDNDALDLRGIWARGWEMLRVGRHTGVMGPGWTMEKYIRVSMVPLLARPSSEGIRWRWDHCTPRKPFNSYLTAPPPCWRGSLNSTFPGFPVLFLSLPGKF